MINTIHTTTHQLSTVPPSEAEILKAWISEQKSKGLVDVKFFVGNKEESTIESFCREVNLMLKSPIVHDPDVI